MKTTEEVINKITSSASEYNAEKPNIIAIAGSSCSGKSTLATQILAADGFGQYLHLEQDNYQSGLAFPNRTDQPYRDECPENFGLEAGALLLRQLKLGSEAVMPVFDKELNMPAEPMSVIPQPHIVWEGVYAFANNGLREQVDDALFLEVPFDIRLMRRIARFAQCSQASQMDHDTSALPSLRMLTSVYRAERDFGILQKQSATAVVTNSSSNTTELVIENLVESSNRLGQKIDIGSVVRQHEMKNAAMYLHAGGFSIEAERGLLYSVGFEPWACKAARSTFDELNELSWVVSSDIECTN